MFSVPDSLQSVPACIQDQIGSRGILFEQRNARWVSIYGAKHYADPSDPTNLHPASCTWERSNVGGQTSITTGTVALLLNRIPSIKATPL